MQNKLIEKITIGLGLTIALIIIFGLLLDKINLFTKPFLIISTLVILLFLFFYIKKTDKVKITKYDLILLFIIFLLPLFTIIFSIFPSSDFWWYHTRNWFILNYLKNSLIGWVPFWHLGYPLLQMYSPGSHAFIMFLTKLISINQTFVEILVNHLIYIFLLLSFFLFVKKYTSNKIAYLGTILLAFSSRFVNEFFIQGHYTNLLALAFGLLALSFLEKDTKKDKLYFILFMSLSLLTHFTLFFILTIAHLITIFISKPKTIFKNILLFFLPVVLSSFWLIPAILESKYWTGNLPGPNPFIFLLLSFGPFLILVLFGLILAYHYKLKYIIIFSLVMFSLALIPIYILPYLPNFISSTLRKVLIGGFKSSVTSSFLFIIFLSTYFIKTSRKYLKYTLLIGYLIFSLFIINVYFQQDSTKLILKDKNYFKDNEYQNIYLENQEKIQELTLSKDYRYDIEPMSASILFDVYATSGLPIPAPRRNLLFSTNEEKNKFLTFAGTKLFIANSLDENNFDFITNLGSYKQKLYDFSYTYFKNILKNNYLIDYIYNPKKFPSKEKIFDLKVYIPKNYSQIIEIPEYKPLAYIADKELWDEFLIEKEIYKIPITHFKKDQNINSYFTKVFDKEEISFTPLKLNTNINSKIDSDKISISIEKINEYIPIYIKINYSPHWKAYSEKKEIPVYHIFPDFMLILVPPNTEKVELIWKKTIYDYIGLILSLLGLIFVIFWIKRK